MQARSTPDTSARTTLAFVLVLFVAACGSEKKSPPADQAKADDAALADRWVALYADYAAGMEKAGTDCARAVSAVRELNAKNAEVIAAADEHGLAPDDIDAIVEAHRASNDRMWRALRPLCIDAIGSEDVVDIVGPGTCTHIIVNVAGQRDPKASREAMRQVAEASSEVSTAIQELSARSEKIGGIVDIHEAGAVLRVVHRVDLGLRDAVAERELAQAVEVLDRVLHPVVGAGEIV